MVYHCSRKLQNIQNMSLHKHPANISNITGMPLVIMATHYSVTNKYGYLF